MNLPLHTLFKQLMVPAQPIATGLAPVLPSLAGIRAVVYDIYGTLILSGAGDIAHSNAQEGIEEEANAGALCPVQQALHAEGFTSFPLTQQHLVQTVRAHQASLQAAGTQYPEVDIIKVWESMLQAQLQAGGQGSAAAQEILKDANLLKRLVVRAECAANPTCLMPGTLETLAALRSAGLQLGIVSNAQFYTPIMLEAYAGASMAQLGLHGADVTAPAHVAVYSYQLLEGKPSTKLYQLAAEKLHAGSGIAPHEVLYVGNDMLKDVVPATAVGFKTALFAQDARSLKLREEDARCKGIQPTCVFTQQADVLKVLGKA